MARCLIKQDHHLLISPGAGSEFEKEMQANGYIAADIDLNKADVREDMLHALANAKRKKSSSDSLVAAAARSSRSQQYDTKDMEAKPKHTRQSKAKSVTA